MAFRHLIGTAIIGAGAVILVVGAAAADQPVHAACPAFPDVPWWNPDHGAAIKIVERRYQDNWAPYIAKWETYRKRMEAIRARGGTAVVKSRDLKLKGDALAVHIGQIKQRISSIRCLAEEAEIRALEAFATAAGGDGGGGKNEIAKETRKAITRTVELASAGTAVFKTRVTVKCEARAAVFQILNQGAKWPALGTIYLYRTEGRKLITKRALRLAAGQKMTFKVRRKGTRRNGNVGLWVSPGWSKRPFAYDAQITCD